jgi:hypothetical protein
LVEGFPATCEAFAEIVRRGQGEGVIDTRLDADSAALVLIATHMGLSMTKALKPDVDVGSCSAVLSALIQGSFVTQAEH